MIENEPNTIQRAILDIIGSIGSSDKAQSDTYLNADTIQFMIEHRYANLVLPRRSGKTTLLLGLLPMCYKPLLIVKNRVVADLHRDALPSHLRANVVAESDVGAIGRNFNPDVVLMDEIDDPKDVLSKIVTHNVSGSLLPMLVLSLKT